MSELNDMECDELADMAAELGLGVLTGRGRADALAHLDRCGACRENVRRLAMTGEELRGLLPGREPPPGFETRVMARLGLTLPVPAVGFPVPAAGCRTGQLLHRARDGGRHRGSGRKGPGRAVGARRWMAAAAVTLAVTGAGMGGWGLRSAALSPAGSRLSSAVFVSASHRAVGKIYVYNGSPRWLYMSVDLGSGDGTVACRVAGTGGHVSTAGSFGLAGGYGAWGGPDPGSNGPPARAWLVSADGAVLATASFAGS